MPEKPATAAGYSNAQLQRVRQTLLYVATKLGDMLDQLTVIGGLVPSLLVDPAALPGDAPPHVGTRDLDLGLQLAILHEASYRTLAEGLRGAGFRPDVNDHGHPTPQRWVSEVLPGVTVPVDFLIPERGPDDLPGKTAFLESDFGATVVPGLELVERDRVVVTLAGTTIRGEAARRDVGVCGPGAFVVLKSLAFRSRGEHKDAYDLCYLLQHYDAGYEAVAERLRPLLDSTHARRALVYLAEDFTAPDQLGPIRAATFLGRGGDLDLRADLAAAIRMLLVLCAPER